MIRELLRDGTRDHHARAEACLPFLAPTLDRAGYAAALAALLGFHAPLESALATAPWSRVGLDWSRRRKTALLVTDLERLGWSGAAVAALPRTRVPRPRSLATALGCAYVVEGSTLGGQLLRRHVARTLGLGTDDGCAFLSAYGADVGPMWRAFVAALEIGVAREGCDPDEVLAAARTTFDALADWLTARLVPVAA
jgi:heme oxygenase